MNIPGFPKRIALAALGFSLAAFAQAQESTVFKLSTFVEKHGSASVRDVAPGASFDQLGYGANLDLNTFFEQGGSLGVSVGYERQEYDWDGEPFFRRSGTAAPAFPYGGIETYSAIVRATTILGDGGFGITGLGGIKLAKGTDSTLFAPGVGSGSLTDGVTPMIGLGLAYQASPDLSVTLGVIWADRLQRSSFYLPMILIDWQINENLTFRTSDGAYIYYDFLADGTQILDAGISYHRAEFDLGTGSGGLRTAGKEEGWAFEVGYTWSPGEVWFIRPYVGWNSSRSFKIYRNNAILDMPDLEPFSWRFGSSLFAGISVGGTF